MTKYKVGQKYEVIKPEKEFKREDFIGKILTVDYLESDGFRDKEYSYLWNKNDKLKLIPQTSKSPRQFMLLKDGVSCKKGLIVEFNGSKYTSINHDKFDKKPDGRDFYFPKEIVENQPEWFKELFKEVKESKEIEKIKLSFHDTGEEEKIKEKINELVDAVNSFNNEK